MIGVKKRSLVITKVGKSGSLMMAGASVGNNEEGDIRWTSLKATRPKSMTLFEDRLETDGATRSSIAPTRCDGISRSSNV